jgi:hypothetical protein
MKPKGINAKSVQIKFRVTEKEHKDLIRVAKLHQMGNVSEYVRQAVFSLLETDVADRKSKGIMKSFAAILLIVGLAGCKPAGPSAIQPAAAAAPTTHSYRLHYESTGGAKRVAINFQVDNCWCTGTPGCIGGLNYSAPTPPWPDEENYTCPGERILLANALLLDDGNARIGIGNPVQVTIFKDGVPMETATLTNIGDYHSFALGY